MKLVIRQYLQSLRERDELDALLPSLLSELGYTVLSRPTRGNRQFGVDVAALGTEDGVTKLFLFSVKQGDLTRKDWDGSDQALRPSINEILDVYIPTRILAEHRSLPIVICLCFGGEIVESMRQTVTGFTDRLTTDRLSFQEWNGDKIAKLISDGPLRQELLPREHRSSFQKAVAMVDEPELAFEHFAALIEGLAVEGTSAQRVQRARQIYLCLWVLFVWARDANNVEAAYLAAERAILRVWGLSHAEIGKSTNAAEDLGVVIFELVDLYDLIWGELFARKILPHVGARNAISMAVGTSSPVDVNLKLFDIIGRLALRGLWLMWLEGRDIDLLSAGANWESPKIHELGGQIAQLIENNPALFTPISEHQAADIALALTFLRAHGGCNQVVQVWLSQMVQRSIFAFKTDLRYPCVFDDYARLIAHPQKGAQEYREEATSGSVLYPLFAIWAAGTNDLGTLEEIAKFKDEELRHCNFQLLFLDKNSEVELFKGGDRHGAVLSGVDVADGRALIERVRSECQADMSFQQLSAIEKGHWPLVAMACRHFRMPVPPQIWIGLLDAPASHRDGTARW